MGFRFPVTTSTNGCHFKTSPHVYSVLLGLRQVLVVRFMKSFDVSPDSIGGNGWSTDPWPAKWPCFFFFQNINGIHTLFAHPIDG